MLTLSLHQLTRLLVAVAMVILALHVAPSDAMVEGLYCGKENCYEVLGVTRDSSVREITRAYRKLARKWHPDRHRKDGTEAEAQVKFQQIATAYETLKDEQTRNDYNYMLDHPEEYYAHYYNYYRHRVAPQVDVRLVLAVTITLISVLQYWSAWTNYNLAIEHLTTIPKYRIQAQNIAKKEGLLNEKKSRKDRGKTKEELKKEEEAVLKKVIESKMDIRLKQEIVNLERDHPSFGGYSKPSILNVLWLQLILFPYTILKYICFYVRWFWLYTICQRKYGDKEKRYLIRKNLKLSETAFEAYKAEQDAEVKAQMAQSGKYKMYKRYMKAGGPGQMSFGPE